MYFHDYESTETIEKHLLEKVCMESVENMSEAELRSMAQELDIPIKNPRKYMLCLLYTSIIDVYDRIVTAFVFHCYDA